MLAQLIVVKERNTSDSVTGHANNQNGIHYQVSLLHLLLGIAGTYTT